jgi:hypothetical protein
VAQQHVAAARIRKRRRGLARAVAPLQGAILDSLIGLAVLMLERRLKRALRRGST